MKSFAADEKPIRIDAWDIRQMHRAQVKRDGARRNGAGWGCCDRNGSMLYVDGIPRVVKYCPACKPLMGRYHRCKLSKTGYAPERYEQVRQRRRAMKYLSKVVEILTANARKPYLGGMTPISNYRASWLDMRIEYYQRQSDGKMVLTINRVGQPADTLAKRDVCNAFHVPADVVPEQRVREDGTYTDQWEWAPVKQKAMELA